jgi:hypothetical protein
MTDWDGIERRQPMILADTLHPKRETVEVPLVLVLVGFAAVLLLQAASLWGHGILADHQRKDAADNDVFRKQISCFVIKVTQGRQGPDVLTDCGFLIGGGPK